MTTAPDLARPGATLNSPHFSQPLPPLRRQGFGRLLSVEMRKMADLDPQVPAKVRISTRDERYPRAAHHSSSAALASSSDIGPRSSRSSSRNR